MKPLNLDNSPCSPISSNCVIWQGPDLACIKLCKGDTVSDVVAKLATELCTILDQLNVNNYDLSCFNSPSCPPADFQALIQFLINHICALEGVSPDATPKSVAGCPDCVVSVASCFIQGNQTTMQLVDYVNMIAERLCKILTDISNLQVQITNLDDRVTILENAPAPTFTLPSILVDCTLQDNSPFIGNGGGATPIDTVLSALINNDIYGYCALRTATGLPADIITAVESQCITSSTNSLLYGTPMGTAYSGSWVNNPETVADSITNVWITLCDVFQYLATTLSNTVVAAGENVSVTSNTVGTTTTYIVNSLGLNSFVAEMTINSSYQPLNGSIPVVDPSMVTGLTQGQIINRYNYIVSNNTVVQAIPSPGSYVTNGSLPACSFGTFDNDTTGQFTITETGMYLVQGSCHLKSNNTSSEFWHTGVPGDTSGSFGVGLLLPGSDILGGQYQATLIRVNKEVDICSDVLMYLTAGTVLRLSLLNLTNRNYNGNTYTSSDKIKFSITQIRSL
jgi:hypothetical protein